MPAGAAPVDRSPPFDPARYDPTVKAFTKLLAKPKKRQRTDRDDGEFKELKIESELNLKRLKAALTQTILPPILDWLSKKGYAGSLSDFVFISYLCWVWIALIAWRR